MKGAVTYSTSCAEDGCDVVHHSWHADRARQDGWSEARGVWRCPLHAVCQYCKVKLAMGLNTCATCADERGP